MINSVILRGNLVKEPEVRYTNSGTAAVQGTIAVNKEKKVGDEWQKEAHYFDWKWFGKRAEAVSKWLKKGMKITLTGELNQNRWEKDGQKHSKILIIVNELENDREVGSHATNSDSGSSSKSFQDDMPF